jgi:hypothetical protein
MQSLDASFQELRQRLRDRSGIGNTGGDPVFYLVFHPGRMLDVKRRLKVWQSQLHLDDWDVQTLSLGRIIADYFASHPFRSICLAGEAESDAQDTDKTLRAALVDSRVVERHIEAAYTELAAKPNGLLLITDVEALHPHLRMRSIEESMQGKVTVPTVILYPGVRFGQFNLSFLGIYPDDGNYRSTHIGG